MQSARSGLTFGQTPVRSPFDVAVIMQTLLRPTLPQAVRSVFAQDWPGRIQILIGVDKQGDDSEILRQLISECPERMAITVIDLGYSTFALDGGLSGNPFGGELRTILSFAANSDRLCYLDDDNWWAPHHISGLMAVIPGFDWAFSYRWFVDGHDDRVLCVDDFESVGPGQGLYNEQFGGFVDTNCLMLSRSGCRDILPYWSVPMFSNGTGEDRTVFQRLRENHSVAWKREPSVYYRLNAARGVHPEKEAILRERGLELGVSTTPLETPITKARAVVNGYLADHSLKKLNLGAGRSPLKGWLNADLAPQQPDIVPVNPALPLPFDDETFDHIAAANMIEHLRFNDGLELLNECFRIMRPGGRIRVTTLNLLKAVALFQNNLSEVQKQYMDWATNASFPGVEGGHPTFALNRLARETGHQFIYDPSILKLALQYAGFTEIQRFETGQSNDPAFNDINAGNATTDDTPFSDYETCTLEGSRSG
jgi:predicted SAM-dependent methyltransferase